MSAGLSSTTRLPRTISDLTQERKGSRPSSASGSKISRHIVHGQRRPSSATCSSRMRDQTFGWTAAHHAAANGDLVVMRDLCSNRPGETLENSGRPTRDVCNFGNGSLHVAARAGHAVVAGFLIGQRASLEASNANGWTPLIVSAVNGHESVAKLLLEAGSALEQADHDGLTASMWAAQHGALGVVEILLKAGVDLHRRDNSGRTVVNHAQKRVQIRVVLESLLRLNSELSSAARLSNTQAAKDALARGAQVDHLDKNGWRPLLWAILHGNLDLVQVLLRYGASPLLSAEVEAGLLCNNMLEACRNVLPILERSLAAEKRLLYSAKNQAWESFNAACGEVNRPNTRSTCSRRTALMWVSRHGKLDAIDLLVSARAMLELRDDVGRTALHHAVEAGHGAAVAALILHGADLKAKNCTDNSSFFIASCADDASTLQILLAAKAELEERDQDGLTAAQMAAVRGCASSLTTLFAFKADLLEMDKEGRSVFARAVAKGHVSVVKSFFSPVVLPPSIRNEDSFLTGQSAVFPQALLSEAEAKRSALKGKLPESLGWQLLGTPTTDGLLPLSQAICAGHVNIVRLVLEHKAAIDCADPAGNTPLMLAAAHGQHEVVELLMELKALTEKMNKKKHRAVQLASTKHARAPLERSAFLRRLGLPHLPAKMRTKEIPTLENLDIAYPAKHIHRFLMKSLPRQLSPKLLEGHVRSLLLRMGAGKPNQVHIILHPITGLNVGEAYVDFESERQGKHIQHVMQKNQDGSSSWPDARSDFDNCIDMEPWGGPLWGRITEDSS